MRRLEADLKNLKVKQLRDLEMSLDLEDVGLPTHFLTDSKGTNILTSAIHVQMLLMKAYERQKRDEKRFSMNILALTCLF